MAELLFVPDVCRRLRLEVRTFYRQKSTLEAAGVLVEALPRLGRRPRYLAAPLDRYLTGETRRAAVRRAWVA